MARGGPDGLTGPSYFDRDPISKTNTFNSAAVAPHGATTRWTYTVPANRLAFVESASVLLMRDGAPGVAAIASAVVAYTPSGGSAVHIARTAEISATVGEPRQSPPATLALLLPGDALSGITSDVSTTGTYTYVVSHKTVEFGA